MASVLSAALASGGTYAAVNLADQAPGSSASASVDGSSHDTAAAGSAGTPASPASASTGSATPDWAGLAARVSPSTVSIGVATQTGEGAGSGVIWDAQGHVVTNAHVVEGAQKVQVTLADGRAYDATVVGTDPSSDLAVLQISNAPAGLTPITVGDDSTLRVGAPVMAIGNPLGLSGTVTTGIVSALDRPVTTQSADAALTGQGAPVVTNAIQTSAAINPGNSGGALLDASGQLVGINSSIASLSQGVAAGGQPGSIGIGFAIPATKVQLIAGQLISTGTATHAFLGVGLADGTAEVDGATLSGAQVQQVEPGSPAATAGLRTGDVVVAIDKEPVAGATALVGQVRERASGQEATLTIVREGARQDVAITFATRPDEG